MSDLTDFLLARIAEDEAAVAEFIDRHRTLPGWDQHLTVDTEYASILIQPERVLAECKFKRWTLENAESVGVHNDFARGWDVGAYFALEALAEVYADHPDYREDWRS